MPHIQGKHTVEDCTFHGARKQSDMLKEVDMPVVNDPEPEAPSSLTPEQMEMYYIQCIAGTSDQAKRRVYAETIRMIKENVVMKSQLRAYKLKELKEESIEETPDDIQV